MPGLYGDGAFVLCLSQGAERQDLMNRGTAGVKRKLPGSSAEQDADTPAAPMSLPLPSNGGSVQRHTSSGAWKRLRWQCMSA